MARNNGGPAFPCECDSGDVRQPSPGMMLRDYFAAHAPEGQLWYFEPQMETKRPAPMPMREGDEVPCNWKEMNDWDTERSKQVNIQWPWVWADAMLKAREAT